MNSYFLGNSPLSQNTKVTLYWLKGTSAKLKPIDHLLSKMNKKYRNVFGFNLSVKDAFFFIPEEFQADMPYWLGEYLLVFSNDDKTFSPGIDFLESRFYEYDLEYFIKIEQPIRQGFRFLNSEEVFLELEQNIGTNRAYSIKLGHWLDLASAADAYNFYEHRSYWKRSSLPAIDKAYYSFEEEITKIVRANDKRRAHKR